MPVQVSIRESLSRGRTHQTLVKAVNEGLLIRDYLRAEISIGELAESLGMEYVETRDWLQRHGVPILRKFRDLELEKVESENFEKLKKEILTK